jgi:hypothetical protein
MCSLFEIVLIVSYWMFVRLVYLLLYVSVTNNVFLLVIFLFETFLLHLKQVSLVFSDFTCLL